MRAFELDPLRQIRKVGQLFGRMPGQMCQRAREMHGVLTRAAADFQDLLAVGEAHPQNIQYGVLIAFAGGGEGEHGASIYG